MNNFIAILIFFTLSSLVNAQSAVEEISESGRYTYSMPGDKFSVYTWYNGKDFGFLPGEDKKLYEIVTSNYVLFWNKPSQLDIVMFSFDKHGNVLDVKLVTRSQKNKDVVYSFLSKLKESVSISINQNLIDKEFKDINFYIGYSVPVRP